MRFRGTIEGCGPRQIGRHDVFVLHLELPDASGHPEVGRRPPWDGCRRAAGVRPDPAREGAVRRGRRSRGPVLLVVPADADVEKQTVDVRFFLSAFEGLSDAEVERSVLPFPSHEVDPYRGLAPHFDIASARARALHALTAAPRGWSLRPRRRYCHVSPRQQRIVTAALTVSPGYDISPTDLGDLLAAAGYTRQDPVDESGEFCVRGGVVDFYPAGAERPIRLEFIGDTIESIRAYDPATQRSTGAVDQAAIVPLTEMPGDPDEADRSATFFDYLSRPPGLTVFVSEPDEVKAHGTQGVRTGPRRATRTRSRAVSARRVPESLVVDWAVVAARLDARHRARDTGARQRSTARTSRRSRRSSSDGRLQDWVAEIKRGRERGETMIFVAHTQGRAERTIELLADYSIFAVPIERAEDAHTASVLVGVGRLTRGFRLPDAALQLWAETDVFEEERQVHERRRSATRTFLSDFRDLKVGDLVVHVDHGIGVFVGLKRIDVGLEPQEFMELRYAGEDKLFVPVERLDLVQKYTGASRPALDRLGGTTWEKAKTRVKKAMRDMAEELLKLYAAQEGGAGPRLQPRLALAAGVRGRLRVGADTGPAERHRRHQGRHGVADADGSAALRRRRLRQDRGRDARRVQGGDGRQAGRVPRADDRPRLPAPEDAPRSLRRLPRPHRDDQPLPDEGRAEADHRRCGRREGRRSSSARIGCCRRTCSSATSACWSSTRSSGSASRTRSASSRCASESTCSP